MKYASKTTVSVDRSRTEIERILQRYGATSFVYGWEESKAMIGFKAHKKAIRFLLPLPNPEEFERSRRGARTKQARERLCEQAMRQKWRALTLAIKAKLEMVETGITSFEEEFLAHIVLPNGQTVAEWAVPQLSKIDVGSMPLALPANVQ